MGIFPSFGVFGMNPLNVIATAKHLVKEIMAGNEPFPQGLESLIHAEEEVALATLQLFFCSVLAVPSASELPQLTVNRCNRNASSPSDKEFEWALEKHLGAQLSVSCPVN